MNNPIIRSFEKDGVRYNFGTLPGTSKVEIVAGAASAEVTLDELLQHMYIFTLVDANGNIVNDFSEIENNPDTEYTIFSSINTGFIEEDGETGNVQLQLLPEYFEVGNTYTNEDGEMVYEQIEDSNDAYNTLTINVLPKSKKFRGGDE